MALGKARGAALHKCEDKLVTLAAAFKERLDKISLDVLRKAEDKTKKAEALLSTITLKLEAKAAALLLDVAAKARRDKTACRSRRRPFIRGNGRYRELRERYLLRISI
jgi:hypothetical protein